MKVLMFGWEYPPHVFGGLATANFGISQGLHAQGDVDITLCLPHPFGDEDRSAAKIVAMNCVPIAWRDVNYDYVKQRVGNIMDPNDYFRYRDHIYADFNYMNVNDLGCMGFAGGYPSNLHDEINNYSVIAGVVARSEEFDIIHAHDWLTFPAGIHAKKVSGKPLCIHVHATDCLFHREGWYGQCRLHHVCVRAYPSDSHQSVSSGPTQVFCHAQCCLSIEAGVAGHSSSRP